MYQEKPDGEQRAKRHAELLLAMANPARMQIVILISQREWSVNSLAEELDMTQSAISQHLSVLRGVNAVEVRQSAQTRYYACRSPDIIQLLSVLGIGNHVADAAAARMAGSRRPGDSPA